MTPPKPTPRVRERRVGPSAADIYATSQVTAELLGRLDEKVGAIAEDVGDLKALSKSYVTHETLALTMATASATTQAAAATAAAVPVAAAALVAADMKRIEPKINALWDERNFIKGAIGLLVLLSGAILAHLTKVF